MNYIITFLAVFITDILYCFFIKAMNEDKMFLASIWSCLVTLAASVAAINYIDDHTMIIASVLGAFCGTYVAMKLRKRLLGD